MKKKKAKMKKINTVFDGLTDSILSRSDKRYNQKLDKSYIGGDSESNIGLEANVTMHKRRIIDNLERYASDEFLEQLKEDFRGLVGKTGQYRHRETIGTHPDFLDLEDTNDIENHYIVSMFVDIKNSTSIYLKTGDLVWTKTFKNTVLKIVTIFMQVFDGHIHRLQGDAVFSYFGWRDKCEEDAIIDALNAASFLLYYVENGLNTKLQELDLPPVELRVGIDFGEKEEVLWSEYGLPPSTEVTTTSLHTDLAAKLQNRASANSIMIGDNIKIFLDLPKEFVEIKKYQRDGKPIEKIYILDRPEKKYRMWVFRHHNYLKYFPVLENDNFSMICFSNGEQYYPNLSALEKNASLNYEVNDPFMRPQIGSSNIRYVWSKENRGQEARDNSSEGKLPANKSFKNTANEGTQFRGHHVMKCKILQGEREQASLKFGVFIK